MGGDDDGGEAPLLARSSSASWIGYPNRPRLEMLLPPQYNHHPSELRIIPPLYCSPALHQNMRSIPHNCLHISLRVTATDEVRDTEITPDNGNQLHFPANTGHEIFMTLRVCVCIYAIG